MIKKLQHIAIGSLAFFYLLLSIGIEVDLHYCLGELKDVKIFNHHTVDETCCSDIKCSLEKSFSCCDNEHLCYQIEDDQLSSKQSVKLSLNQYQDWVAASVFSILQNKNPLSDKSYTKTDDKRDTAPAYLLNCSFIYYG